MAQRRMFSLKIVDTDAFLDMPATTQNLYFHLSIRADDEGFVASPKKIMKITGCSDDDLKILISKSFIIPFQSGICVIRHWRIHNYIQSDRREGTQYKDEASLIYLSPDKTYEIRQNDQKECLDTKCIQNDYKMSPQVRLGKDRLEKEEKEKIKKEKEENLPLANANSLQKPECVDLFEEFWSMHKRRDANDSKQAARVEFGKLLIKIKKGIVPYAAQQILAGTKAYAEYCDRCGVSPGYVLSGRTFLRDEHFLTEWKNVVTKQRPELMSCDEAVRRIEDRTGAKIVDVVGDGLPF